MDDLMNMARRKLARDKDKRLPPRAARPGSLVVRVPDPEEDLLICAAYATGRWRRGTYEDGFIAAGSELCCAAMVEPFAPGTVDRVREHLRRDATADDYRFDFAARGFRFDPKCVRRSSDYANLIVDDPKPDVRYPLFWAMDQVLHGDAPVVRFEFLGWSEGDPELFDAFPFSVDVYKPYRPAESLCSDASALFGLPPGTL